MTWARPQGSTTSTNEESRMGVIRAEEAERLAEQNGRAVLTVAGHATNSRECAELLEMLGLDATTRPHRP